MSGRVSVGYWRDVLWSSSGTFISSVLGLAAMPILSRIYTPVDFSIANIFLSIAGPLSVLAAWRLDAVILLPATRKDSWRIVQLVLFLGVISTVMLSPIGWLYSNSLSRLLGSEKLQCWIPAIPLAAAAMSISAALVSWHQRNGNFRRAAAAVIGGRFSYVLSAVCIGKMVIGEGGLIIAGMANSLGNIALSWERARWKTCGDFHACSTAIKPYLRLCSSLVFSHLTLGLTTAIPIVFISRAYPEGEVGQFSMAYQTISLPSILVGNAIGNVYYQRAAQLWVEGQGIEELWQKTAKSLFCFGIPAYTAIILLSPRLFPLVFGDAWVQAGNYASVLAIAGLFSFTTTPLDRTGHVTGASTWHYPIWHLLRAVTVGGVVLYASINHLSMGIFVFILTCQMTAMYLYDFIIQGYLAKTTKRGSV